MNKEEIENYISELESMFELSELENHSRNILKVGIYIKQLQQENQELKKQLEELEKENFNLRENIYINKISFSSEGKNIKELIEMPTYEDLTNQQKEFIEYLESEINKIKEQIKNYDIWHEVGTDINFLILKKQFNIEILSKYKEIIGGKE